MRVLLTDRYLNLVEEHVDLALRIGELADSSTIGTRVGSIRLVLCASPAYLKKRGTPKQPADLAAHDCVVQEDHPTPQNWKFFTEETTKTIQVPSRLAVTLGETAVSAATAGAGIACVLSYLVDDLVKSGSLVKLLGAYESPPTPVSLIYPSQRQVPGKLRAFPVTHLDGREAHPECRLGQRQLTIPKATFAAAALTGSSCPPTGHSLGSE